MQVGVLGINHKSASFPLREKVAQVYCSYREPNKVLISTCNRTEIYFSGYDLAEIQRLLFKELKERLNHSSEHAFYSFFGPECFYHLACVTAGLDSALLGETDVQRQVKIAYETARLQSELSSALHYLFQKSLKLAKDARSCFPLFHSTMHLEGIVFQLTDSILDSNPSLLLIGNSDINRKIIHYFYRKKKGRITLVTRDLEVAYPFAIDYGLSLKSRDELVRAHLYDGIISATTTEGFLISSFPSSAQTRLIVDLTVPRSINPELGRDPSRTLLNMQQLGDLFAQAHTLRHAEVEQVKQFLESSVFAYTQRYHQKAIISI